MKMYELIKRLEHIRDKMESTFSNEFQRGEIDNLIEELIQMTPEVGEKLSQQQQQVHPYYPTYPIGTGTTPIIYNAGTTSAGITLNGNISWTSDLSSPISSSYDSVDVSSIDILSSLSYSSKDSNVLTAL